VVADGSGSFSTSVTVPADTPAGAATVVASSDSCDHTASTGAEVLSAGGSTTPAQPTNVQSAGATTKPTAATPTQVAGTSTLARTGSTSGPLVALAVGLTGLGAIALLAARRRSSDVT
jgi:LPXTG-motif cell wall-anchored protein